MSNQPESSDSKGTKRDFSTAILEKKVVNYDNSVGDAILKASDTNKLDSEPIKIRDRYEVGVVVAVMYGRFLGRFGSIKKIEKHDTIHVEDPTGDMFVTQTDCVRPFCVGGKPFVRRDQSWATVIEIAKKQGKQREEERRRQKEEERRLKKEVRRLKKMEERRQKKMEERRQKMEERRRGG